MIRIVVLIRAGNVDFLHAPDGTQGWPSLHPVTQRCGELGRSAGLRHGRGAAVLMLAGLEDEFPDTLRRW